MSSPKSRSPGRVAALALAWVLVQLFWAVAGPPEVLVQRAVHLALALAVAARAAPGRPGAPRDALAALALGFGAYVWWNAGRLEGRVWFVDPLAPADVPLGLAVLGLLLWTGWRLVGPALCLTALAFAAYGLAGPWLGALVPALGHPGASVARLVELQVFTPNGVLGLPTGVSADYVFYFVLFAAVLEAGGGRRAFAALAGAGGRVSPVGAARVGIGAATLMGTVSGSALATVVSTGVVALPLLRRAGYSPRLAGALMAVAATGAQLMPPVMGAGAFVMAGLTGIPYRAIIGAAVLPALAYYAALYLAAVFRAPAAAPPGGDGPAPAPAGGGPAGRTGRSGAGPALGLTLAPIGVLLALVLAGRPLMVAALYGLGAALAAGALSGWAGADARPGAGFWAGQVRPAAAALAAGAEKAVMVAVPCAIAGTVVGVIFYTGLALKLTGFILAWSGGRLLVALVLAMGTCLLLGMGMPTSSAYIMAASLLAPALVALGLEPLVAHLFIFYFAILSMVTPPVALAAYAAAGLTGAGMMATGWEAFKLSLPAFLVPFAFAYNPALVGLGTPAETLWAAATTLLGVAALAAGVAGRLRRPCRGLERPLFFVAAAGLIIPGKLGDLGGLVGLVVAWLSQSRKTEHKCR